MGSTLVHVATAQPVAQALFAPCVEAAMVVAHRGILVGADRRVDERLARVFVEAGDDFQPLRTVLNLVKAEPESLHFMPRALLPAEEAGGDAVGGRQAPPSKAGIAARRRGSVAVTMRDMLMRVRARGLGVSSTKDPIAALKADQRPPYTPTRY
jgi:hypothetical protein